MGTDDPDTIGADEPNPRLPGEPEEGFLFLFPFHPGLSVTRSEEDGIGDFLFRTLLQCPRNEPSLDGHEDQIHFPGRASEGRVTGEPEDLLLFWVYGVNFPEVTVLQKEPNRHGADTGRII